MPRVMVSPGTWSTTSRPSAGASAVSDWIRGSVPSITLVLFPNARWYTKTIRDGQLRVLRTIEQQRPLAPWRMHLSISHIGLDAKPGRYPTWDEQKEAVWRFGPGRRFASYLPAEGDPYVNVHETCFHWWEVSLEAIEEIQ